MYNALNWSSLSSRRHTHWLQLIFKCIYFNYPPYLKQYLVPYTSNYEVRHSTQLYFSVPQVKKTIGKRAFKFKAPADWNNLSVEIRSISLLGLFKHALSAHFKINSLCYYKDIRIACNPYIYCPYLMFIFDCS